MAAKKSKTRKTKARATKRATSLTRDIKPVEVPFKDKLQGDRRFLISLIDDPVKTFREYGFNGDDKMMAMLQGMSSNLRQRAILVFTDILKMDNARNACDACNGCRACKACMTMGGY